MFTHQIEKLNKITDINPLPLVVLVKYQTIDTIPPLPQPAAQPSYHQKIIASVAQTAAAAASMQPRTRTRSHKSQSIREHACSVQWKCRGKRGHINMSVVLEETMECGEPMGNNSSEQGNEEAEEGDEAQENARQAVTEAEDVEGNRVGITKEEIVALIRQKSTQIELKQQEKVQSKHWENFLRVYHNTCESKYVSCKSCKAILKQDRTTGTSVLKNHRCKTGVERGSGSNQIAITQFTKKNVPQGVKSEIAQEIAIWCASSFRPFSLVEDSGFHTVARHLLQLGHKYGPSLEMKQLIPVATTISRHVDKTHEEISLATKSYLKKVNPCFKINKNLIIFLRTNQNLLI